MSISPNRPRGRKPKASLRRLTPQVFDFLTRRILHVRAPLRLEAARLHMVEGLPMFVAAEQTGLATNNLENLRRVIAEKDDLLAAVYRS